MNTVVPGRRQPLALSAFLPAVCPWTLIPSKLLLFPVLAVCGANTLPQQRLLGELDDDYPLPNTWEHKRG